MFALSPTFRLEFLARTDFLLLVFVLESSSSISFCRRAGFAKSADLALLPPPRVVVCDILLIIAGALQEDVSIIDINFFVSEVCGVKKTERDSRVVVCDILLIIAGALQEEVLSIIDINFFV